MPTIANTQPDPQEQGIPERCIGLYIMGLERNAEQRKNP